MKFSIKMCLTTSNVIKISDYSPICMTSSYTTRTVLSEQPSDNEVVIDFDGIVSMTCQYINAIFGELVLLLLIKN